MESVGKKSDTFWASSSICIKLNKNQLKATFTNILFHPTGSLGKYCLYVTPLAIIPNIFIALLVVSAVLIFPEAEGLLPPSQESGLSTLVGLGVVTPLIETLLLAATIELLKCFTSNTIRIAVISALVWGFFHSLVAPLWEFSAAWMFFIFATAYLVWRPRSWQDAFWAAAIIHIANNSLAVIGLIALHRIAV